MPSKASGPDGQNSPAAGGLTTFLLGRRLRRARLQLLLREVLLRLLQLPDRRRLGAADQHAGGAHRGRTLAHARALDATALQQRDLLARQIPVAEGANRNAKAQRALVP